MCRGYYQVTTNFTKTFMEGFFNKIFGRDERKEERKEIPTISADDVKKFFMRPRGSPLGEGVASRLLEDEEFVAWRAKNGLELDTGRKKVIFEGREVWFETSKDH